MLIFEFRIPMPFTTAEYKIGQLYTVAEMSLNATGGGEGVEVLRNEQFKGQRFRIGGYDKGTYTYKIYRMESKIPGFIRLLSEPGKFDVHEEAWNAFPYCRTYLTNPGYMKDSFSIEIESIHLDNDRGETENALQLCEEDLKARKVVRIDIGNDQYTGKVDMVNDPARFISEKRGRGPLRGNWIRHVQPMMTAYKLVKVEFKFFGLQRKVEHLIQVNEHRLFTQFHRQLYCTLDAWMGMSMQDIRRKEDEMINRLRTNMDEGRISTGYSPADLYESKSHYIANK